ncbi:MAG: hypothetical protein PGN13_03215 [Patulibacter minatonensis]
MPSTTTLRQRAVTALALSGLAAAPLALAPAAAHAKAPTCTRQANEIVRKSGSVLFRKSSSLFSCTAGYGDPVRIHRLGPWSKGFSKVSFDGSSAVWTAAGPAFEGVPAARIWAANAAAGKTWIKGLKPVPGQQLDDTDNTVTKLKAYGQAAAWITAGGAVVAGSEEPAGTDPDPIGTGTPAFAPAPIMGVPQGVSSPLKAAGHRALLGRWTGISVAELGKSLRIAAGEGDGDECGGGGDWRITVTPIADQPEVGASWYSGWTSTSDACRS